MKTVAIIQARMSSRRLPGKVLMDIGGAPLLSRVIGRARRSGACDEVVVATSGEAEDDAVAAFCDAFGVPCFRGSLDDVLDRYLRAAMAFKADAVIRLTGDCPLLDPSVVAHVVDMFKSGAFDYVSNVLERTYPDGLDTEVLSLAALKRLHRSARLPAEREHVTPFIHRHPESFRIAHVKQDRDLSALRWVVDTPRDLAFVRAVYRHFGDAPFGMAELLSYLKDHPDVAALNAGKQEAVAFR